MHDNLKTSDASPGAVAAMLAKVAPNDPLFATEFVGAVLLAAREAGASDVHLTPTCDAFEARWRIDGVLHPLAHVPKSLGPNVIARLKVLAGLLTYEMALPQEGRIRDTSLHVEVRVSTFPTLYGERAVLRLLGSTHAALDSLEQLGLPKEVLTELQRNLGATSGAILIVGPAGSGKTTTAYAALREIVALSRGGRSIASLEDPIEVAVDDVAQTQVNPVPGLDLATGLRSLLRLDPEVIFIGEMRDLTTTEVALQAALTGQLVMTTFHAGNCTDAVRRLIELGVPEYAVRNAVRLIIAQRLVRRLCTCAEPTDSAKQAPQFQLDIRRCLGPVGCARCFHSGYSGRTLIAECRTPRDLGQATPEFEDSQLLESAIRLIETGITSAEEVCRVLGVRRKV